MFTYGSRKKMPFKPVATTGKKRDRPGEFVHQSSLNVDAGDADALSALQKTLGNRAAIVMLEELAKARPVGISPKVDDRRYGVLESCVEEDGQNEDMEARREADQFQELSGQNSQEAEDAVKKQDFRSGHERRNQPNLRASDFMRDFSGFQNLITVMKVYVNEKEKKDTEVREADLLLKEKDLGARREFDLLMRMIRRLPEYTDNEKVQRDYFRVYRFIIASGIDLHEFFSLNGDLSAQREMILKALGSRV